MSDRSSCNVEPDVLSAFMDEELPEERMEELRDHVRACDHCSERLSRLRETQRVARTVNAPSAPDSFVSDVRERIEDGTSAEREQAQADHSSAAPAGGSESSEKGTGEVTEGSGSWLSNPTGLAAAAALLIGLTAGLITVLQPFSYRSAKSVSKSEESMSDSATVQTDANPATSPNASSDGESSPGTASETTSNKAASDEFRKDASESSAGAEGGFDGKIEKTETKSAPSEADQKQKKKIARADESENQEGQEALDNLKNKIEQGQPDLSPVLVRLRGKRSAMLNELTSALSALDSERVVLLAHVSAETPTKSTLDEKTKDPAEENAVETRKHVRVLSLDTSPEQLSELLEQNATLELVTRGDEAKLFLGALVQQGQSPAVLSTEPEFGAGQNAFPDLSDAKREKEEQTDAGQKEESFSQQADDIRRSVASLQQSNIRLQQCRTEWTQESQNNSTESDDAESPVTGDAISVPALRRFLRRYQKSKDGTSGGQTDQKQAQKAEPGTDSNTRREVLREWLSFLDRNPSSWSASDQEDQISDLQKSTQQKEENESGRRLTNRKHRLNEDYLDIHLRVQESTTPALQQQLDRYQKQGEK